MTKFQIVTRYRPFLVSLVKKEFKVRYTQSILGSLWMIIEPLLLVLTLSAIFTMLGRKDRDHVAFPIFFYAGLLPWNLFKAALVSGAQAFIKDKSLMQKIRYPKEITIFKSWMIYFIEFLFSSVAFFVILAIYWHPLNIYWLYLPLLIILIGTLSIGIMFFTASLNIYVRDVGILLKTLGTVWFWFSPIIFDFPYNDSTKALFILNPMVGIIKGFRSIIVHGEAPNFTYLLPAFIFAILALIIGYLTFRKVEKGFVDVF